MFRQSRIMLRRRQRRLRQARPNGRIIPFPQRQTKDAIRDLARLIVRGDVWDLESLSPQEAKMTFPLIALGAFDGWTPQKLRRIYVHAVIGQDTTSTRGVDGRPMFFSMRVWRRDDARLAHEMAARMHTAMLAAQE